MQKLLNLIAEEQLVKQKIKERKVELHGQFYKLHKKHFIVLDILVVLIILMNFGAIFMTNYLITKTAELKEQRFVVKEANPIQAKAQGWEEHSESKTIFPIMMRMLFLWAFAIWGYIHYRFRCFTKDSLYMLVTFVLFCFVGIGYDFFNNLGYFVRILLW